MHRTLTPHRHRQMKESIVNSITDYQREHRTKLYVRLLEILHQAADEGWSASELYIRLHQEPPIWVLAFVETEDGNPLFLSPWQCQYWALYTERQRLMGLMSRKVGKTTMLAAILTWALCSPDPTRIVAFSPTEAQSFIFNKCRHYINHSPYLNETFLTGPGSKDTDRELVATSGSSIHKGYVSATTKGEQARGQYGDIIVVDEIQSIGKEILDEIIEPMVADAFSAPGSKRLIYIGTPHTKANPDLPSMWDRYRERSIFDESYGTYSIDCWQGVEEGCLQEAYVRDQEETLPADVFAREYLAVFPDASDGYLSAAQVKMLVDNKLTFARPHFKSHSASYIMSVDWARHQDRTQILVGRLSQKRDKLQYVDWLEIDHSKGDSLDYQAQVERVLDMFWAWDCDLIIPDSSGTQDMMVDWLRTGIKTKGGKELRGIPEHRIYGYEPDKRVQTRLGFKASLESNYNMYLNHRNHVMNLNLIIPGKGRFEQEFVRRYVQEHSQLVTVQTMHGIRYEKPKRGFKDLVSAAAMMSLALRDRPAARAAGEVGSFDSHRPVRRWEVR